MTEYEHEVRQERWRLNRVSREAYKLLADAERKKGKTPEEIAVYLQSLPQTPYVGITADEIQQTAKG